MVFPQSVRDLASAVPQGLVLRWQEHLAAAGEPVPPRDAATVVLLRDSDEGLQAYLLRRVASMAFAAGMYVFPGGRVDPRDGDVDVPWSGADPSAWGELFRASPSLTRALVCAAVRETFEESGVLLAGPDGHDVVADTTGEEWEADRQGLLDRTLVLSELLARRGLLLRADLLRPWTHWVTPEFEPRRYDTRFLVAALPAGQRTRDVGGEADRVAWVRPIDAVAGYERGELAMLAPTVVTLAELSDYDTVANVLDAAPTRTIRPVMPRIVSDGEGARFVFPGDPGYPA